MTIENVLYRATAEAFGGREGRAVSSDGILDIALSTPKELGGAGGNGTNPEQLFAAGYSACFLGALKFVAARDKLSIPADTFIEGTVGIGVDAHALLGIKLDSGKGTSGTGLLPLNSQNEAADDYSAAGGALKLRAFDTEMYWRLFYLVFFNILFM